MDGESIVESRLGTVSVTPVPDWIGYSRYDPRPADDTGDAYVDNGVRQILQETNVNICGDTVAWFYRSIQRVLTRAGAERAANFMAQFDPAFQRIEVHLIRILRDGGIIEHAAPSSLQTFRRETDLERSKLNGMLTVSLLIPDIRLGDAIEVAVTVWGANSVFGGKYVSWVAFDPFRPSFEISHRMVRPLRRSIAIKPFNNPPQPDIVASDEIEDSRWTMVGPPRRDAEPATPSWLVQAASLQFSEFKSWNEVAQLFVGLYESTEIPASLANDIDQLALSYPQPAARAVEWLRFVQQKLRYFALSLNEGGLIPRSLDTIWQARFGDCKDAARLYIAGARRLGLDACAALISTTHAQAFDTFLPSPNLFNHCIVRLRLDGRSYWLDPTLSLKSGSLKQIFQPYAGWALPLSVHTQALEKLDVETPVHFLKQEWDFFLGSKWDSPARLRRRVTHLSWTADIVRNAIANQGESAYAKQVLKELQSVWPETMETDPLVIDDDPEANRLVSTLSYEIRNCWKPPANGKGLSFQITDFQSPKELGLLKAPQRVADIHLGRPRKITHVARMHMPRNWAGAGWDRSLSTPEIDFVNRLDIDGKTVTSTRELTVSARTMPNGQLAEYAKVATKLQENSLFVFGAKGFGGTIVLKVRRWRTVAVVIWVVLWLISALSFLAGQAPAPGQ